MWTRSPVTDSPELFFRYSRLIFPVSSQRRIGDLTGTDLGQSLFNQQAWSGNGGDPDLLELAGESPERGGITLGGKPHDGGPLENSAHGFHSLKVTVAPRLHDEPEVVVTEDRPALSSDGLPESYPWLAPKNFQATLSGDRDGTLRIHHGQPVREVAKSKVDPEE